MEFGMDVDDDFGRVFGMEDTPCESSMANQPPQLCDTPRMGLPTSPSPGLTSQGFGMTGQAVLSANTRAPNTALPSPMFSQGTSDIPSLFTPQQNPLSSSNTQLPALTTASFQRQRPVPKRLAPVTPPSKGKATATVAVVRKRREDAIQQARDLRRELLTDIGKSKG
ncbi:hypothetical protein BDM02DRAFT_3110478 [Thelephora ganbajun]|uniref:Uncharacterized protein n=1 Tax=Thelephora ganbajun TaxID=370292 RepID=A0ACB6ZQL4_THEGA|nr:hypothetical protein BDM02DRAFT_3110478 [Thelephora ganbajun]